jgi:hypothetical protein
VLCFSFWGVQNKHASDDWVNKPASNLVSTFVFFVQPYEVLGWTQTRMLFILPLVDALFFFSDLNIIVLFSIVLTLKFVYYLHIKMTTLISMSDDIMILACEKGWLIASR